MDMHIFLDVPALQPKILTTRKKYLIDAYRLQCNYLKEPGTAVLAAGSVFHPVNKDRNWDMWRWIFCDYTVVGNTKERTTWQLEYIGCLWKLIQSILLFNISLWYCFKAPTRAARVFTIIFWKSVYTCEGHICILRP